MVEYAPQTKADEQYPLLKVSSGDGAGDGAARQPLTTVSPGWNVTCSSKRSLLNRWPEIATACWMTGILLGISFLVMYVLTMGAIRKHSVVIIKCNNSKPGSEVYFHEVIQRESRVPFIFYSDYLEYMTLQYPFLQFNVFFLIDDSLQSNFRRGSNHAKLLTRLMPLHSTRNYLTNFEESNTIELRDFQSKYENVNITVIPLSKYMAQTPLRYKWRHIPVSHLTFYARVFSVWRTGGIGMDLASFSNKFNSHQHVDSRIASILQQHNQGINPEEYVQALNIVQKKEENEIFAMVSGLINLMLNETCSFFNRTFSQLGNENNFLSDEPRIRTHRNKRDITEESSKIGIENNTIDVAPNKLIFENSTRQNNNFNATKNIYQTSVAAVASINDTKSTNIEKMYYKNITPINIDEICNITDRNANYNLNNKEVKSRSNNTSDLAKIVIFYDFSLLSDALGPSYTFSEPIQPYVRVDQSLISSAYGSVRKRNKGLPNILSIDSDGLFVSASSQLHPFLGGIISAGCQRMSPKFVIQNTHLTQCGALFKDDVYCNNIFLL